MILDKCCKTALSVTHALRRPTRIHHLPDCIASVRLMQHPNALTSSCSRHQARFLHLRRCPLLYQELGNTFFRFLSPKSLPDLCILNCGQMKANFSSKSPDRKPIDFLDSDKCMVFDGTDSHAAHLTFVEARALAGKRKCRLVYMHKNPDGTFCFKLQTFAHAMDDLMLDSTPTDSVKYKPVEKSQKSSVKEFKMKTSIGDHDLTIKLNKIQALLVKGKQVLVLLSPPDNSSKAQDNTATVVIKKLTEELKDICKVKPESSKGTTQRLMLIPKEKLVN